MAVRQRRQARPTAGRPPTTRCSSRLPPSSWRSTPPTCRTLFPPRPAAPETRRSGAKPSAWSSAASGRPPGASAPPAGSSSSTGRGAPGSCRTTLRRGSRPCRSQRPTISPPVPPSCSPGRASHIDRPSESFKRYTTLSLKDYATGNDIPESGREGRRQDLQLKFGRASEHGATPHQRRQHHGPDPPHGRQRGELPLQVLERAVQGAARPLHRSAPHPRRRSSDPPGQRRQPRPCPRRATSPASTCLGRTRTSLPSSSTGCSDRSCSSGSHPTPEVGRSSGGCGEPDHCRRLCRCPRLERRTMVAGWFLGQIVGRIAIPPQPYVTPVGVDASLSQAWNSRTRCSPHRRSSARTTTGCPRCSSRRC